MILVLAYYECPNMCTLVLNALLQSAQDLKFEVGKEYQIIVVSIDPHEEPALAAAKKQIYTQRYGRPGAANGWHFLTGDEASIRSVANSVGFRFVYDPKTRQFAHPSVITVLTPTGKVSRYFAGIEYPPKELRLALIEASNNHIGSLTEQLFLLCFHYDPASGKYGLAYQRRHSVCRHQHRPGAGLLHRPDGTTRAPLGQLKQTSMRRALSFIFPDQASNLAPSVDAIFFALLGPLRFHHSADLRGGFVFLPPVSPRLESRPNTYKNGVDWLRARLDYHPISSLSRTILLGS